MTATRIEDLENVEVEHLIGLVSGEPLVKLRAESMSTVLVGQLSPAQARDIAAHLVEAAARAEYEHDLLTAAKAGGFDDDVIAAIFSLVRSGEARRLGGGG